MPYLLTGLLITVLITVTNCAKAEGSNGLLLTSVVPTTRGCLYRTDLGQGSLYTGSDVVSDQSTTNGNRWPGGISVRQGEPLQVRNWSNLQPLHIPSTNVSELKFERSYTSDTCWNTFLTWPHSVTTKTRTGALWAGTRCLISTATLISNHRFFEDASDMQMSPTSERDITPAVITRPIRMEIRDYEPTGDDSLGWEILYPRFFTHF
jgi:hypothetical protein